MHSKRLSLLFLVCALFNICALAEKTTEENIEKVCSAISNDHQNGDSQLFVKFISTVCPKTDTPQSRNTLSEIYSILNSCNAKGKRLGASDSYASPDIPQIDAETFLKLLELLKSLGMTDEEIDEMLKWAYFVYPLYVYQIEGRVAPDKANNTGIRIDTIFQAPIDEAFYGIGDSRNNYVPEGLSINEQDKAVSDGAILKRNGTYVWGMIPYKNKLYWSTNNNYLCMEGYGNFVQPDKGDQSYSNKCWVCEYDKGIYGQKTYPGEPEKQKYSDIRPPHMYCYDPATGIVNDITPSIADYPQLQNAQGLRSAGAHNGVVFFGGPGLFASTLDAMVSATFIAYDADAERVISTSDLGHVDGCKVVNVRRWRVINNVLYVAVGIIHPETGKKIGAVLRWYGDKNDPWNFHIVGLVDGEAAEIAYFNNRIYVGTWGDASRVSSVCVSAAVPSKGLEPVSINSDFWKTVWTTEMMEPTNTLGRTTSSIAGFHEWKGHLYWGLFSPNFFLLSYAQTIYGTVTSPEAIAFILGNWRTPSFWRIDRNNKCDMLYGEKENPKPIYDQKGNIVEWKLEKNGQQPFWGRGGFGNFWTIYIWALQEYNKNLYIGTMDCSQLFEAAGGSIFSEEAATLLGSLFGLDHKKCGYELLRMTDENRAPKIISDNGLGNDTQYGVRNLEVLGDKLFLGSASMSNIIPYGGWHVNSIHEHNATTDINQQEIVKPGIIMGKNDEYINFATVAGDDILSIEVFDASGRKLTSARPQKPVASIPLNEFSGIAIVKITSASGSWTAKIK